MRLHNKENELMETSGWWETVITSTVVGLCLMLVSCSSSSMLPLAKGNNESVWESFGAAKAAFDKIVPNQTSKTDLAELRIDPFVTPNIKILNYLDIIKRFMPHDSITKEDIDLSLRECIEAENRCQAYEISLYKVRSKRYGSVFLDLFRFKRKVHKQGWNFWALVVLKDDIVVYKIWSGQPIVDEHEYQKNPLGPLQDPAGAATGAAATTTVF